MTNPAKIEISHKTILFTIFLILAGWFIYNIFDILLLLFISFILMTAFRPFVDWLGNFKIPRIIAILIVYTLVFGIFGVSLAGTIPTIIEQFSKLAGDLPFYVERLLPYWTFDIRSLTSQISPIGQSVVKVTVSIFSNAFATLTVIGFTFYLLLEREHGEAFLKSIVGEELGGRILAVTVEIENRLGAWVQGELLLMFFIGIIVYLGLIVLHVNYALPLAILAGLLEIVPLIGPTVSAIPAVLVALGTSPWLAITVVALYIIVQQVENNIVVPIVMKRSVGLSPLVTILALMIGNRFAGVMGAVLAVPFVLVLQVIIRLLIAHTSEQQQQGAKQKIPTSLK